MTGQPAKFRRFISSVLPHEWLYLESKQAFVDRENIRIMAAIRSHIIDGKPLLLDPSVDKRKYSYLKKWMESRLTAIDVDRDFEWIQNLDFQIMNDFIDPDTENELLKRVKEYDRLPYYFMKFYETVRDYRFYLLIRFRRETGALVDEYLSRSQARYNFCLETNRVIQAATVDIVDETFTDYGKWERTLLDVFYNGQLDGLNRYLALIRLTLVYLNSADFEKLKKLYADLDPLMATPLFYSRRILANYYSNCLLLHAKLNNYPEATRYGYLAIKSPSGDYLHYLNMLAGVLMRQGHNNDARMLLTEAQPRFRNSRSLHNKVGYAAFYTKALHYCGQSAKAAKFAESFLEEFKENIFNYRWHTFFVSLLQALVHQEKFSRVRLIVNRYKLMEHDEAYRKTPFYLPTIPWYYWLALYKQLNISASQLESRVIESFRSIADDRNKVRHMKALSAELIDHFPTLYKKIGNLE